MSDTSKGTAMIMLRGRARSIQEACRSHKIEPDPITAAALIYNAMKIMKLPADDILEGPVLIGIQAVLSEISLKGRTVFDPTDPDAPVTLTGSQLMTLIHSKLGDA
jgi:hypothetical protein